MATRTTLPPLTSARGRPVSPPPRRSRVRLLVGFLVVVLLGVLGLAGAVLLWSGATVETDASALAVVKVQALGGSLVSAKAVGPDGRRIPLAERGGRLTPTRKVTPGERISIDVVVRRPGWNAWALGKTKRERLTVRAPVAHPSSRWLTVGTGAPVTVGFDRAVSAVTYDGRRASGLTSPHRSISLGRRSAAGSVQIAAAARPWEKLGQTTTVSWFPKTSGPVAVASPAPGGKLSPADPIRLTFSRSVGKALGSARPTLSPDVPGSWKKADSHTLVFTPTGFGAGFDTKLKVGLPRAVSVTGPGGSAMHTTREVTWTVPPGATLRLHQLLAQAGYLPLRWKPAGADVKHTAAAEVGAAVEPPKGRFVWRYPNTPPELKAMWTADKGSEITRGALMKFQDEHGLDVDAVAGPALWKELIDAAMKGKRTSAGYSYVYVHRDGSPQTMTLWHAGKTVISSPANTGVAAAPTELGTFPVFEHLAETTMSGTNPDGSHYSDPGIKYVSYFNGGDALHAFDRASFGTPQSVGCVELPLASAAKIYPYTPIGTLVTVES